jgi:hypothetical protein
MNGEIPLTLDVLEELFNQLKVMHAPDLDGSGAPITTPDCGPSTLITRICHWNPSA